MLRTIGLSLLALALGGITRSSLPTIQVEANYRLDQLRTRVVKMVTKPALASQPLPASVPVIYTPLLDDLGNPITPVNNDFSLIVPKVGINAAVVPAVDPTNTQDYEEALRKGVAHASTSFFPDENGVVYLFSHSTNYEWFVRDLNAVFYLLKNLNEGDRIVLIYKNKQYIYQLREKRVVAPTDVSFMAPIEGKRMLILQTCWPPGSTAERLLLFSDLISVQ